ncbi:MAG: GrdX family protein, partial [Lachnospiraceae bacterium]|nr:GrdX family protein [Lachnospiraceae bacterium]
MKPIIITNNPKVFAEFFAGDENLPGTVGVDFREDLTQEDILLKARDLIHLGGRLIIHPMMGRIKPHETPYKSVFMEIPDEGEP